MAWGGVGPLKGSIPFAPTNLVSSKQRIVRMLLKQTLRNHGFLFIRHKAYTLFVSSQQTITGFDIEKMIFECHSIGVPILDARTTKHVFNPPTWKDAHSNFDRFRSIGVYICI